MGRGVSPFGSLRAQPVVRSHEFAFCVVTMFGMLVAQNCVDRRRAARAALECSGHAPPPDISTVVTRPVSVVWEGVVRADGAEIPAVAADGAHCNRRSGPRVPPLVRRPPHQVSRSAFISELAAAGRPGDGSAQGTFPTDRLGVLGAHRAAHPSTSSAIAVSALARSRAPRTEAVRQS